jgi:hypothetical protein
MIVKIKPIELGTNSWKKEPLNTGRFKNERADYIYVLLETH